MRVRVQEYVLRSDKDSYHHVRARKTDKEIVYRYSHESVSHYNETYQQVTSQIDRHKKRKRRAKANLGRFRKREQCRHHAMSNESAAKLVSERKYKCKTFSKDIHAIMPCSLSTIEGTNYKKKFMLLDRQVVRYS